MASPRSTPKRGKSAEAEGGRIAPARKEKAAAVVRKRRRREPRLTPKELAARLRSLYVEVARRGFRSVSSLSRASKVPYETLRHYLESDKHQLTPANEEKLARALGFRSAFFRWLIDHYDSVMDWQRRCLLKLAARAALWMVLGTMAEGVEV